MSTLSKIELKATSYGTTPYVEFKKDRWEGQKITLSFSSNGFQTNSYGLSVEMFDALCKLTTSADVVEYVENLRTLNEKLRV